MQASLVDLPELEKMTEKETAHPSQRQLDKLTRAGPGAALFSTTGGSGSTQVSSTEEETKQQGQEEEKTKSLATNLAELSRQQSETPVSENLICEFVHKA